MPVSARAWLPETVRLTDVADTLGTIAGLPAGLVPLRNSRETIYAHQCDGARAYGFEDIPTMARIELRGEMVDGEHAHECTFHFEADDRDGRLLMATSSPFWCAVFCRLVDVFGGTVDYYDSDSSQVDYGSRGIDNVLWSASDGVAWDTKQRVLSEVPPITPADMDAIVAGSHIRKPTRV